VAHFPVEKPAQFRVKTNSQFPNRNENTTREAVSTAIVAVRPAIGVFAQRSRRVFRGNRPATADFAYHHLTVLGKTVEIDVLEEFGCGVGAVLINGARLHSFPLPSDPGHPLDALCDLATRLRESQRQLNAGDIVVLGAGPTILQVLPSQEITVDLGALGSVSCVFA
jgi:2-keto-4-pentenoate hydratase